MTPVIFIRDHRSNMDMTLSRRERKKQETRRRLLEIALKLFREQGYDTTPVKQITKTAGIAKGTFFNYFDSKEAILPALAEWRLQQLEEALTLARGAPPSPVARIKMALRLVAEDLLTNLLLSQQLFAAMIRQQEKERIGAAFIQLLAEQVRQAQAAGEIRADLDPLNLGGMIHALFFQQMIMWHYGYRPTPLQEMLAETVNLLLDGAAGPEWQSKA
jgi:AcrR family transcriptional regulator